jgi:AraC-like DNA-binding protein
MTHIEHMRSNYAFRKFITALATPPTKAHDDTDRDCLGPDRDVATARLQTVSTIRRVPHSDMALPPFRVISLSIHRPILNCMNAVLAPRADCQLTPLERRRVAAFIDEHIEQRMRVYELANLVSLSSYHFSRCFRRTFGEPPHAYVMRRRIAHSQFLMITTRLSLGQIAFDCGLSDQAHLIRLFRRFNGQTPAAWRRFIAIGQGAATAEP